MIAAIAQIIHLQGIAAGKDAATPVGPCPKILGMGVAGQPETIHIAETVTCLSFIHDTGIIFYRYPQSHFLLTPQCQTLWRQNLTGISAEGHMIVRSLRLHPPKLIKLPFVQPRLHRHNLCGKEDNTCYKPLSAFHCPVILLVIIILHLTSM